MTRSPAQRFVGLATGVLLLSAGSCVWPQDGLGLQPPKVGADRPLDVGLALADQVRFVDCDAADDRANGLLQHLEAAPVGTDVVRCYLAGPAPGTLPAPNEQDLWSAGVMYLPASLKIDRVSFGEAIAAGAVDLALNFNLPHVGRAPPTEADPDNPAGGYAPFEAPGGDRAVVQQVLDQRVRAVWRLASLQAADVQFVVTTGRSPEDTIQLARALRDGPPPDDP